MVDCGELSVTNGRVFYSHCTAYNSVATYSCNAGYDLIGANTRTCSASGDWSGSPPTCSGKFLFLLLLWREWKMFSFTCVMCSG